MWDNGDKVWENHEGILATDLSTAKFLHNYLRYMRVSRSYANCMEVIDLQSYKIQRNIRKVKQAINEQKHLEPFIFFQYLN